jgi:hypothetical protein
MIVHRPWVFRQTPCEAFIAGESGKQLPQTSLTRWRMLTAGDRLMLTHRGYAAGNRFSRAYLSLTQRLGRWQVSKRRPERAFYPLEISQRFWSGRSDSNPRPQPWQDCDRDCEAGVSGSPYTADCRQRQHMCRRNAMLHMSVNETPKKRRLKSRFNRRISNGGKHLSD